MENEYQSIWDFEPQIVDPEFGTEPSLRTLIFEYYIAGGYDKSEANKLTARYIREIDNNY